MILRGLWRLDTVTSVATLLAMYLVGIHHWSGWLVALVNQGLWAVLIYRRQLWGLIPMAAVLTALYAWNLIVWLGRGA